VLGLLLLAASARSSCMPRELEPTRGSPDVGAARPERAGASGERSAGAPFSILSKKRRAEPEKADSARVSLTG
jgi:hypothetical protein